MPATARFRSSWSSRPGAEVTQSGIYDYNFNTRGFNSSLNRRVATLIDGRNPAVPFLGAQEWAAMTPFLSTIFPVWSWLEVRAPLCTAPTRRAAYSI